MVRVASFPQPSVKEKDEDDIPRPDRWRRLVIDQSTPEEATKKLGAPKKDRTGGLRTYPLNKRLTVDHNSDDMRKLYYDSLGLASPEPGDVVLPLHRLKTEKAA